jgi:tetratricopeptide (TPR) repeat protein
VYIADALCREGFFEDGLECFTDAAEFARDARVCTFEALALNGIGCVHLDLGHPGTAIEFLQKAIDVGTPCVPPMNLAEFAGNLGMAHARNGNIDAAVAQLSRARDLYRAAGNERAVEVMDAKIPEVRQGDRYEGHFVFADPAASIDLSDPKWLAHQLEQALGHEKRGEYAAALSIYQRLLHLAREIDDRRLEAVLLIRIGFAARRLSDRSQAMMAYHQALSAARKAADAELEALALNNLGVLYGESDRDTAVRFLEAAASIRERLPDKQELGETYLSLSKLTMDDVAAGYLKRSISLLDPDRNVFSWAEAYRELKRTLRGEDLDALLREHRATARRIGADDIGDGVEAAAIESLHEIVPLHDGDGSTGLLMQVPKGRLRPPDIDWQVKFTRAGIAWIAGRREDAIRDMFASIDAIEQHRAAIAFEHERGAYLRAQWDVYDTLVSYLVAEKRFEHALEVIERVKARSILDIVAEPEEVSAAVPSGVRDEYRRKRRELRGRLEEMAEFQHLPDARKMQAMLRARGHAFLCYWLGEKSRGAFLVSHGAVEFFDLPDLPADDHPLRDLEAVLKDVPAALPELERSLPRLHRLLIEPVAAALEAKAIDEITIIPHHQAHLIPFHALRAGDAYLIDRCRIDHAPSFALYEICGDRVRRGSAEKRRNALVVGDPDDSLPSARVEAKNVAALLNDALCLIGGDATVERVLPAMSQSDIIHLACHGEFGADQASEIALRLAPAPFHDGLLTLRQITNNVNVAAGALVVLSACETGRSLISRSDEYVGLPAGFILAGAAAVVGSLWQVEDESTSLLMQRFYAGMAAGLDHADALRAAQQWLREYPGDGAADKPFSHPYYWAGFFAVGPGARYETTIRAPASRQRLGHRRHRRLVLFTGADAIHLLHRQDEDLSVADLAGARGGEDGLHGRLDEVVGHADLDPHLLGQADFDRRTAVGLHQLRLAAVAFDAADAQAAHFSVIERLQDVAQFLRPHDRDDQLHRQFLSAG